MSHSIITTLTSKSWTIFRGDIDQSKFGKARDSFNTVEDCLEVVGDLKLRDKGYAAVWILTASSNLSTVR